MSRKIVMSMALVVLLLSACQALTSSTTSSIQGSGNVTTAERSVVGFSGIEIKLGANLILNQGNRENLTVEADDNLMQYLTTEVHNGKLVISTPNHTSISPSQPIRLSVTFKALSDIAIFGSSDITATNLDLDTLNINFSGSGSTRLTGRVNTQNITIQGTAHLNNFDLSSRNVIANISGNGTLEVNATDTLGITVAGIGNIRYIGNPSITKNIMGAASITPR